MAATAVVTLVPPEGEESAEALEADNYSVWFAVAPVSAVSAQGVQEDAVLADATAASKPVLEAGGSARIAAT